MTKTFTYLLIALLMAASAAMVMENIKTRNMAIEEKAMAKNLDSIMERTMYDENVHSKIVKVAGGFVKGTVDAEAVYTSFRGDTCRIIIHKELGPLGWPGVAEIKKRCKVTADKITS